MTVKSDPTFPLLMVAGPTASGKSNLAVRLAKDLNGEIVNIDSVQIYRGMEIGSAKIKSQETMGIPHHLLDICPPNHNCNVAEYLRHARQIIQEVQERGKLVIFTGGTTLYITHLLHGLADLPQANPEIRAELENRDLQSLYTELQKCDPQTAQKLHPNDKLRIVRALETFIISGSPVSALRQKHAYTEKNLKALTLVLCPKRNELYDRINFRSEKMLQDGLIEETRELIKSFGSDISALKTLGYKQACQFLRAELTEKNLASEIAMHTRRYAKRQITYWRNEPRKRGWQVRPEQKGRSAQAGKYKEEDEISTLSITFSDLLKQVKSRIRGGMEISECWYLNPNTL